MINHFILFDDLGDFDFISYLVVENIILCGGLIWFYYYLVIINHVMLSGNLTNFDFIFI